MKNEFEKVLECLEFLFTESDILHSMFPNKHLEKKDYNVVRGLLKHYVDFGYIIKIKVSYHEPHYFLISKYEQLA